MLQAPWTVAARARSVVSEIWTILAVCLLSFLSLNRKREIKRGERREVVAVVVVVVDELVLMLPILMSSLPCPLYTISRRGNLQRLTRAKARPPWVIPISKWASSH